EQSDIAGHESRRGKAKHLPEGEIPGHNREHDAKRLVRHVALRRLGPYRLVGQEFRCMLGVIATGARALRRLIRTAAHRLPHLTGHETPQLRLFGLEYFGGATHRPGALRHARATMMLERGGRAGESLVELGVAELRIAA